MKAIIILEDKDDGCLDLKCEFDPEITDDTRSYAVSAALAMIDWFANRNSIREVEE